MTDQSESIVSESAGEAGPAQPVATPRVCEQTGVDITHQPPRSRRVSFSTLESLATTDPVRFEQLRAEYCPADRRHFNLSGQCYAMADAIQQAAKRVKRQTERTALLHAPDSPSRLCEVTGLDIAGQRATSRTISGPGLGRLAKADPVLFARLAQEHLPAQYVGMVIQIQCEAIARVLKRKAETGLFQE